MDFQISALEPQQFAALFDLPNSSLAQHLAVRRIANANPGFPCRVSLQDAQVGEQLLLVHYTHQGVASPYRASHAIFVRKGVPRAELQVGEVPPVLRSRMLSLRAFDKDAMIVSAELCAGARVERVLRAQLSEPAVAYVHIHFAKFGCYACRADRM
jgi:hypothetical protein